MAKLKLKAKSSRKKKITIVVCVALVLIVAIAAVLFVQIKKHGEQIDRISINTYPDNTKDYYVNDEIDITGLSIKVHLNNGDYYIVDGSECEILGFDSSKAVENQKVTVTYQGFSCTFNVVINKIPKPTPILTGIYLDPEPNKTEYRLGERLNTDGGVLVLCYQDGSEYRISLMNSNVTGFKSITAPGTYSLTVSYYDEATGITQTTTYTITVTK